MQQKCWKKDYTTKQLEKVQLKSTVKVQMPKSVLYKIKFLCKAIPEVEWSGILLYSIEGSIRNPKNMIVTLQDIIPMNKGSKGYTEYEFNEKKRDVSGYEDKHIDYCKKHPEALNWRIGHIHSHNNMKVFFSGTDMSELNDNSASYDFYLSLIVNNWMNFCAKIAFRGSFKKKFKEDYLALDEKGKTYPVETLEYNVVKEKLYIYDCDIDTNEKKLEVDDLFSNSVMDIIKKANKSTVDVCQNYKDIKTSTDVKKVSEVENFIITLLRGTNPPDERINSIESALEEVNAFTEEISPMEISWNMIDNYPAIFEKCFEKRVDDDLYFIELTKEVIDIFQEYEIHYEFLSNTIIALKYMIKKYENYATI